MLYRLYDCVWFYLLFFCHVLANKRAHKITYTMHRVSRDVYVLFFKHLGQKSTILSNFWKNLNPRAFCAWAQHANHSATEPSQPTFITLPASIASDRRVMPNSHRSTRRDETNSHNTTYSFIANCQTAVVHKNKTKLKSKIYKSRYILRYNILTVKLQSLIREMRSIVELVASGDVSWVGDSRRESWTVWTISHGGLDYSLLATQQWHLGQQSVAGSGLTAAAVDRLYRPVCLSSNILLELERFPAFLSDFPDCYRYFWAHPFLFLVPHFLVLISSLVRAVD